MALYYVNRDGKNLGPYAGEKVVRLLRAHQLSLDDLCVEQGAEDWQPLRDIVDPAVLAVAPEPDPQPRARPAARPPFDPDDIHFTNNEITVTNTRLVVGAQTFAMANIRSVTVERHDPPTLLPGFLIIGGICLALIGLGTAATGAITFGIVVAFVGMAVLKIGKSTFWLVLTTPDGEVCACTSRNQTDVQRVVVAINRALIERA
jgi:hypothetical protein